MDPENLVFFDEMGTDVGLARLYGRRLKGQRLYDLEAIYRGKNLTAIGAISLKRVLAFETLTKAMNGEEFKKFLRERLIPELWKGAALIMDTLSARKVEGVEETLREVGVKVIYLSLYSLEFNPIEHLWSELKSFARRFAPKTEGALRK
ncbi:transposase [Pannus brasiliensis CCIBt3594]|uniref:Transposase n=1 Tax=Pannus brasiliensis CCIBt3594 TaxID=1427578 RepID=A0AAW9QXX8_9CHRO